MNTPDRPSRRIPWDETPEWADATFKSIMWVVGIGTVLVMICSFMADDLSPIKTWLGFILAFEGSWLLIAGSMVLLVKLFDFLRSRIHARRSSRPGTR